MRLKGACKWQAMKNIASEYKNCVRDIINDTSSYVDVLNVAHTIHEYANSRRSMPSMQLF